ncbi:hypothetical protein KEM52_000794 [Ascosphaera acerosa]|nr:hypothetical protein KEM52_000794 [Ascosphaera acerosa]
MGKRKHHEADEAVLLTLAEAEAKKQRPGRTEQEEVYAKTVRLLFDAQRRVHQQQQQGHGGSYGGLSASQELGQGLDQEVDSPMTVGEGHDDYALADATAAMMVTGPTDAKQPTLLEFLQQRGHGRPA